MIEFVRASIRRLWRPAWCICCPDASPFRDFGKLFEHAVRMRKVSRCKTLHEVMDYNSKCGLAFFGPGDSSGAKYDAARTGEGDMFCDEHDVADIGCRPLIFWCDYSRDWLRNAERRDWIGLNCVAGYEVLGDALSWWRAGLAKIFEAMHRAAVREETKAGIMLAVDDLYADALDGVPARKRTMLALVLAKNLHRGLVIERDFPSA